MNTDYIKSLKTPIAIIGLGKSGLAALNLLHAFNYTTKDIIAYDEKHSEKTGVTPEYVLSLAPKTLVVSPGVALSSNWIQKLIAYGAHLTSEITLAASLMTTEKIIGVTGSIGKSTVVSFLEVGVKSFSTSFFVGGNIGTPFCAYALSLLKSDSAGSSALATKADWIILELSSYQLENCALLSLDYSIITFLSPNHLERYSSLEEYYQTKLKIIAITKEVCLLNKTSKDCENYLAQTSKQLGAQKMARTKLVNADHFSHPEFLPQVYLLGLHNKDNFSLAAEVVDLCGWPQNSFVEMAHYRGLPHRLEFVAELKGVTYINDSKATAMDSVLVAAKSGLERTAPDGKLFLLLGGKDKNLPWSQLSVLSTNNRITPVFFGACGLLAKEQSSLYGEYFEKLGSAINYCQRRAQAGDVVALSPGGTSLDEFKNFEERGDFFKSLVLNCVEA